MDTFFCYHNCNFFINTISRYRIGIRTVQKSTGKKSETTTVVFTKALFRDHKENKENLNSIS